MVARVLPYWHDAIVPELRAGLTPLVVAHGNSLRALVKHLEDISDDGHRRAQHPHRRAPPVRARRRSLAVVERRATWAMPRPSPRRPRQSRSKRARDHGESCPAANAGCRPAQAEGCPCPRRGASLTSSGYLVSSSRPELRAHRPEAGWTPSSRGGRPLSQLERTEPPMAGLRKWATSRPPGRRARHGPRPDGERPRRGPARRPQRPQEPPPREAGRPRRAGPARGVVAGPLRPRPGQPGPAPELAGRARHHRPRPVAAQRAGALPGPGVGHPLRRALPPDPDGRSWPRSARSCSPGSSTCPAA